MAEGKNCIVLYFYPFESPEYSQSSQFRHMFTPMHIMYLYAIFHIIQDWRRRYFILKGSRLFFAKTPYEAPHGMIDLSRCTTVKSADLKAHKKNSFEISTPDTTYLLYAGECYCVEKVVI